MVGLASGGKLGCLVEEQPYFASFHQGDQSNHWFVFTILKVKIAK